MSKNNKSTLSPEEISMKPNEPSKIRWMFRLKADLEELGIKDIINLGIGQAGHDLPEIVEDKLEQLKYNAAKYPQGVTSDKAEEVISNKMLFTHFTDEEGQLFANKSESGSVFPGFYVGEHKDSKSKTSVVGGNGASGFLTAIIEYASNKGYKDIAFTVPYFGPYEEHFNSVKRTRESIVRQTLESLNIETTEENIDKNLTKNSLIDLTKSGFHFDKQSIDEYKRLLKESDGKVVITLCSPNNPSGTSFTKEDYNMLIKATLESECKNMPIFLMDEPYDLLTFNASGNSNNNNVDEPLKAKWRQHISITHSLHELVKNDFISERYASRIMDNCFFVNSASKGVAAAGLGGGCVYSTNTDAISEIQKAVVSRDGPLRATAIASIEEGFGYYVSNPEKAKELAEQYGEKVLSFKKWMNYACHKNNFPNENGKNIAIDSSPDGGMYVMPDVSGFIGLNIPETDRSKMLLDYKKFIGKEQKFENAEDVALFLMFEKGIVMVPGDGFGLNRIKEDGQPVTILRASVGESSLEQLKDVANRYGEAIKIVKEFNKSQEMDTKHR
jgi:aspartate/methionine/tyrosine aminotransferase